jgi:heat shock protein HtpX
MCFKIQTSLLISLLIGMALESYNSDDIIMQTIRNEYSTSIKAINIRFFDTLPVNPFCNQTLYKTVHTIALAMNVPVPYVYIQTENGLNKLLEKFGGNIRANAMAIGFHDAITEIHIGDQLLTILNYQELRAVIAHELGHVKHHHVSQILKTQFNSGVELFLMKKTFEIKSNPWETSLKLLKWPCLLVTLAIQGLWINKKHRQYEKEADAESLKFMKNKDHLINALKKLEAFHGVDSSHANFLRKLFSTHPTTEERDAFLSKEMQKII